jgi:hypothetical protein
MTKFLTGHRLKFIQRARLCGRDDDSLLHEPFHEPLSANHLIANTDRREWAAEDKEAGCRLMRVENRVRQLAVPAALSVQPVEEGLIHIHGTRLDCWPFGSL